jgi:hypothetical protein
MSFANIRIAAVSFFAFAAAIGSAAEASAGSLTRTIDDTATPDVVCVTDDKEPPTRTLITKDGKIAFVETEMARDDAKHLYSYTFMTSPLLAPKYLATISIVAKGATASTIVWHGDFTAQPGTDKDVETALANICESGLAALKVRFAN